MQQSATLCSSPSVQNADLCVFLSTPASNFFSDNVSVSPGHLLYKFIIAIVLCCIQLSVAQAQLSPDGKWKPLFNGKDLSGWDTYLRAAEGSADSTPIGLNKDPHHVFTVKDNAIRISGQDWGAIISKEEYSNYHIRFQVRFGEKKWPPREDLLRDGGLMFHSSGPNDYGYKCWMRSNEMQIQETEIGDFFNAGEGTCEFQVSKTTVKGEEKDIEEVEQYDADGEIKRYDDRVYRSGNFENPHGEWTTGEMIARGADAVFIVNGFVVNRLYNTFRKDLGMQTTRGKLQFQSESSEYYLKKIEIRPVDYTQKGNALLESDKKELLVSPDEKKELRITNKGHDIEIIAAELMGKKTDQFIVKLPALPLLLKKGETLVLPVSVKPGAEAGNRVRLRLETVTGPVAGFEAILVNR